MLADELVHELEHAQELITDIKHVDKSQLMLERS